MKEHTERKKLLQSPNRHTNSQQNPSIPETAWSLFPLFHHPSTQPSNACAAASGHVQSRKGRVKQPLFLLKAASGVPFNL